MLWVWDHTLRFNCCDRNCNHQTLRIVHLHSNPSAVENLVRRLSHPCLVQTLPLPLRTKWVTQVWRCDEVLRTIYPRIAKPSVHKMDTYTRHPTVTFAQSPAAAQILDEFIHRRPSLKLCRTTHLSKLHSAIIWLAAILKYCRVIDHETKLWRRRPMCVWSSPQARCRAHGIIEVFTPCRLRAWIMLGMKEAMKTAMLMTAITNLVQGVCFFADVLALCFPIHLESFTSPTLAICMAVMETSFFW